MTNVTISLDEDVARRARVRAAKHDKSLSRFIAEVLERELAQDDEYWRAYESWKSRPLTALREDPSIPYPRRDDVYDRPVLRRYQSPDIQPGRE